MQGLADLNSIKAQDEQKLYRKIASGSWPPDTYQAPTISDLRQA